MSEQRPLQLVPAFLHVRPILFPLLSAWREELPALAVPTCDRVGWGAHGDVLGAEGFE